MDRAARRAKRALFSSRSEDHAPVRELFFASEASTMSLSGAKNLFLFASEASTLSLSVAKNLFFASEASTLSLSEAKNLFSSRA